MRDAGGGEMTGARGMILPPTGRDDPPPKEHAQHPSGVGTLCGRRGAALIVAPLERLAILARAGGACRICIAALERGQISPVHPAMVWRRLWREAKAKAADGARLDGAAG